MYEYQPDMQQYVDIATKKMLGKQAIAHMQWRDAFFRASGAPPSNNAFLIHCHQLSQGLVGDNASNRPPQLDTQEDLNSKIAPKERKKKRRNALMRGRQGRKRAKEDEGDDEEISAVAIKTKSKKSKKNTNKKKKTTRKKLLKRRRGKRGEDL